jgi:hypothetical protein
MSRPIEFRFWYKLGNKYISDVIMYEGSLYFDWRALEDGLSDDDEIDAEQWTGLYDKNKRKIFENDIVIFDDGGTETVLFIDGSFMLGGNTMHDLCGNGYLKTGNIHEGIK